MMKQAVVLIILASSWTNGATFGDAAECAGSGCNLPQSESSEATAVALYGLVSWATVRDSWDRVPTSLIALFPATDKPPECKGKQSAPKPHVPVLKIIEGQASWRDCGDDAKCTKCQDCSLPKVGNCANFSIKGLDVTFDHAGHSKLSPRKFARIASGGALNKLRADEVSGSQYLSAVRLDTRLLSRKLGSGHGLAARVFFEAGWAEAGISDENVQYLAELNNEDDCPNERAGSKARTLADEMVVRLRKKTKGHPLVVKFGELGSGRVDRELHLDPSAGGGIRIELSHQVAESAKQGDSRCLHEHEVSLADYLWYYDLRASGNCSEENGLPVLFPCSAGILAGGTKCPEHFWGDFP